MWRIRVVKPEKVNKYEAVEEATQAAISVRPMTDGEVQEIIQRAEVRLVFGLPPGVVRQSADRGRGCAGSEASDTEQG
jgi:hypothetical protein